MTIEKVEHARAARNVRGGLGAPDSAKTLRRLALDADTERIGPVQVGGKSGVWVFAERGSGKVRVWDRTPTASECRALLAGRARGTRAGAPLGSGAPRAVPATISVERERVRRLFQ
jgi:hypothetical protein